MKKLIGLCLIVGLLAACQPSTPTPPPESVVTETLAESASQLHGIWYNPNHSGIILSINGSGESSDLTYSIYNEATTPYLHQGDGAAKFENGNFSHLTNDGLCVNSPQATWKFWLVKQDGFVIGMRLELIGTDGCEDRAMVPSSDIWYYSGSAAMPEGVERPPKTGGELLGIWYNQSGLLMNFDISRIDLSAGNAEFSIMLYVPTTNPWGEQGVETAKYENGKFIWLTSESVCADAPEATYEIAMIVLNDEVIGIRPTVVGDDLCAYRKSNFNNRILRRVNHPLE